MRRTHDKNDTFWISYADLMAGLLFVFVLLVGAIVIKFLFLQHDVKAISQELLEKQHELQISLHDLEEKKKRLDIAASRLSEMEKEAIKTALLIRDLRAANADLEARQKMLETLNRELNASLNDSQIALSTLEAQYRESSAALDLSRSEIETLSKQLLTTQDEHFRITSVNEQLKAQLQKKSKTLFLKEEELSKMAQALLEKSRAHQQLVEELDLTKLQIKHLTGIRIGVINALKASVGDKIAIDPKNGSIRFQSGVFFEQNGAELTPKAKSDLEIVLYEYINTLMNNPAIAPHLDAIIIEGHTNSDGAYLYNLQLSQKRAYKVMEYLLSRDFKDEKRLKKLLSASGRGYADRIYKNGIEDKEASRRIEIKFRLKDEEAIRQIEKILG